jgi:hypothetical protein
VVFAGVAQAQGVRPVALGTLEIVGAVDAGEARRVVTGALPRFGRCYQERRAAVSDLRGVVVLRVYVSSDGEPVATSTRGSLLGDALLRQCIEREGMSLRFAEHDADSDLRFALLFGGAEEERPGHLPEPEVIRDRSTSGSASGLR